MEPEQVQNALRSRYAEVANRPAGKFNYPVGRGSAAHLEYRLEFLDRIPSPVIERFVGVGNPFSLGTPQVGWKVVDIGSGCGLDSHMSSLFVGNSGEVRGVDMSPGMLEVARAGLIASGFTNLQFLEGRAESLPIESEWADLVISNGVLNLATCKQSAFSEVFRVLKPGGRFQAVDLILVKDLPSDLRDDQFAWSN